VLCRAALLSVAIGVTSCAAGPGSNRPQPQCDAAAGVALGSVNSGGFDGSPTVSADETELLFTSNRTGQQDIFVTRRANSSAQWGEPANIGPDVNDAIGDDFSLRLSDDGRSLFFASTRTQGAGTADLYVSTRESRQERWGRAINLGPPLNTDAFEAFPTPSADGRTLYFNRSTSFDSDDSDLWVSTRTGSDAPWVEPSRLRGSVNSERAEFSPSLSIDGHTMWFASARRGSIELWVSTRESTSVDWGAPVPLGPGVNVPRSMTLAPFVSHDGRALYFMSARPAADASTCSPSTCFDRLDLYVARIVCR
jgi:Tol biopolymer transport system component